MSLINQMLQDLDARTADGVAGSAIHGQVRAVAERHKVHLAWWIALVLAGSLIAVLSLWFIYRTQPVMAPVQQPAPAELSLKIAPDLEVVPLPALPKPVAQAAPIAAPLAPLIEARPTDTKTAASQIKEAAPVPIEPVPAKPSILPKDLQPVPAAQPVTAVKTPPRIAPKHEEAAPVTLSKQARDLTPQQRAENDYRRASSLIQQGRVTDAVDVLEQVLLLDPQHAAARQTLVGLLLEGRRQDDAMRKMREGLNLDPNQPGLAMILARQQVEKGELRAAVETLQKTLPHALERADYQAFLAALLQRQSNHKEAVEHYLVALRKMPQNGLWWMGLGISLQAENRLPDAQDAFGRAKASSSLSPELLAFVEQRLVQLQR